MAKKASGRRAADPAGKIIETAMRLAVDKGWRDLGLVDIAEAAGLPLSEVYPIFDSKQAILNGLGRRIDIAVLQGAEADAREGSARDRMFDVLMRRFDALQPYRAAFAEVAAAQLRDPLAGLCSLCQLRRSMRCMLEAADLSVTGLQGELRLKSVTAVYLATLRVWLKDEDQDMARTMAALDRHLGRLEGLVRRLRPRRGDRQAA